MSPLDAGGRDGATVAPADVTTTPTTSPAGPSVPPADPPAARVTKPKAKRGKVISYTFRDDYTGQRLDGIGIAVDVPDDGSAVCVAPLQSNYLFVPAEGVQVVELDG